MTSEPFEPLPLSLIQRILTEPGLISGDAPPSNPYEVRGAGVFTRDWLRRLFDDLWNEPHYFLEPRLASHRELYGRTRRPKPSTPDWTVEADGWRLVIENGAMVGIEQFSPEIIVRRWP